MPRYISVGSTGVAVASGSGTTNRLMRFDSSDDAADGSLLDDGSGALKQPGAASDVAPTVTSLIGAHAYAQASSNTTGAVLRLAPGIGRRFITVDDYAQAGTGTVTVTVNGTATVLTAGTDFTAATSNAVTATNLATAIEAIAGVSATASSAVVYVTPDDSTYTLTLARSVAAFATVTSGTDGNLTIASGQLLLPAGSAAAPTVVSSGATTSGAYFVGTAFLLSASGSATHAFNYDSGGQTKMLGAAQHTWVSGTDVTAASDTGVKRAAAGVVQVTDGSTGIGTMRALGVYATGAAVALGTNSTTLTAYVGDNSNGYGFLVDPTSNYSFAAVAAASGSPDLRLRRAGAGSLAIDDNANGKSLNVKLLTELTTVAAAATTDTTIEIPAGAIVLAVSVRVTTVIPTAATFTVTGAGTGTTFSTAAVSTAANTTNAGTAAGAYYSASAQKVRITPNLTPGDTTGRVRVTIHYIDITPPTS